jgi:uncharacterized protein (TIGR02996 family)
MTEASLLAAIRDEPDDDLPRLAYADWCEERGDGARAEFIRVQVELSHGVRDRGRAVERLRRLRELSARYRAAWAGPLEKLVPGATFERGFITEVALAAADFLKHGERILTTHPITSVVIHHAADRIAALAASPLLAGMRGLDLHWSNLGDRGITLLAASPHLGRLNRLILRHTEAGIDGLRALARSSQLKALSALDLAGNNCEDLALRAFTDAMALPALTRLDLAGNSLESAGARSLAECRGLGTLRMLRLANNRFTRRDVEVLARSTALANLQVLDVTSNGVSASVAKTLRREFGPRLVC